METYDLSSLMADDFKAVLNKEVQIYFLSEGTVAAEIVQVLDLPNHSDLERTSFSVVFITNGNLNIYPQGIYKIRHPALGDMHVFLVPIARDANGIKYEAIFS